MTPYDISLGHPKTACVEKLLGKQFCQTMLFPTVITSWGLLKLRFAYEKDVVRFHHPLLHSWLRENDRITDQVFWTFYLSHIANADTTTFLFVLRMMLQSPFLLFHFLSRSGVLLTLWGLIAGLRCGRCVFHQFTDKSCPNLRNGKK